MADDEIPGGRHCKNCGDIVIFEKGEWAHINTRTGMGYIFCDIDPPVAEPE